MGKLQSNRSGWTRGKCIGKGSFGSVNMAVRNADGGIFAVKSALPNQIESLENEIRILRSISGCCCCPYIVKYLGDDVSDSSRNLHLEYMPGGTVADVAGTGDCCVDERILRWRIRCVVSALKFVHAKGIVHCDVKGKNVLVGPNSVKLADFGSASYGNPVQPRGSPLWMAPEVVRGEYQGPESDVWSLGCTIIEMITGKPAWEDRGLFDSLNRIGFSNELPELPSQLSGLGCDFVSNCLRRDRNQRWSCDQLLEHPFISSAAAASPPPSNSVTELSPRCVLDFMNLEFEEDEALTEEECEVSARERISKLASSRGVNWESDGWVEARNYAPDYAESTSTTYPNLMEIVDSNSMGITESAAETNSELREWQYCNYENVKGLKESVWYGQEKVVIMCKLLLLLPHESNFMYIFSNLTLLLCA